MKTMDSPNTEPEKKGGMVRGRHRGRHASGGHTVNEYNAQGSPEMEEASNTTPGFNKGGRKKRAAGGLAEGGMAAPRADRMRRGDGGTAPRAHRASGGGTPYSSGRNMTPPADSKEARGYEGVNVPDEPQ